MRHMVSPWLIFSQGPERSLIRLVDDATPFSQNVRCFMFGAKLFHNIRGNKHNQEVVYCFFSEGFFFTFSFLNATLK